MASLEQQEQEYLEVISEAALVGRDWRAAVKWLEVHFPEKYKGKSGHGGKRKGAGNKTGNQAAPDRVKLRAV